MWQKKKSSVRMYGVLLEQKIWKVPMCRLVKHSDHYIDRERIKEEKATVSDIQNVNQAVAFFIFV